MNAVEMYGQISDLKEIDYRNTLAIATLIELLISKGFFTRKEFAQMAYKIDHMSIEELKFLRLK